MLYFIRSGKVRRATRHTVRTHTPTRVRAQTATATVSHGPPAFSPHAARPRTDPARCQVEGPPYPKCGTPHPHLARPHPWYEYGTGGGARAGRASPYYGTSFTLIWHPHTLIWQVEVLEPGEPAEGEGRPKLASPSDKGGDGDDGEPPGQREAQPELRRVQVLSPDPQYPQMAHPYRVP